jgi:UDP-N-acetylglucosamine 2-epimerase (non-hydrolysing)
MKQRIRVLIGTRPEIIKLAPFIIELQRRSSEFDCVVCSTGQHKEMFAQAMEGF